MKNKEWYKKLEIKAGREEEAIRKFLRFFSFVLLIVISLIFITALAYRQFGIALVILLCFILIFSSWLKLNPKLYNKIYSKKKIIPFREDRDIESTLKNIYAVDTLFGMPFVGMVQNNVLTFPTYMVSNTGYVVYFYLKNNNFYIRQRKINLKTPTKADQLTTEVFQKELLDMFAFIINMERMPFENEVNMLFEKSRLLQDKYYNNGKDKNDSTENN